MILLKIVLYPIIVLYFALALFAIKSAKKIFIKYRNIKTVVPNNPEWEGFIRSDFNKWREGQIFVGCVLRFPLKFLALLTILFGLFISMKLGKNLQKMYMRIIGRFLLSLVFTINDKANQQVKTPIVIANHVSWIDIIYLATRLYPISFVAKEDISKAPIIGQMAKQLQSLFVRRQSLQARQEIKMAIQKRVKQYKSNNSINSVLIFPEGTTSNGRAILRFKNGAFSELSPITLFALIYDCEGFDMGMDEVTPLQHFIISLSLSPKIAVLSTQITALQGENEQEYKLRCQLRMSQLTGFRIYNSGFTEKCQFKELREAK